MKKNLQELLTRGVENIYPKKEFLLDLLEQKKIKLYLGIDPTGPTLHLGHAIILLKLKQFQDLGHEVIILIGSFTAMIGDPTDKGATRKQLTREQVLNNAKKYQEQIGKILKLNGDNPVRFVYNGDWLDQLKFQDVIELASNFTVQRMLERDMFEKRIEEGKPIGVHEFLYPLMQGYDSVALDTDGEIGGNDQTFNMLAGRTLLRKLKNKEKFVITMKLLTDSSGEKMGKTTGNMITLENSPEEMYGAVMSWSDGMILNGFLLCTFVQLNEIQQIEERLKSGENPKNLKMYLAREIIRVFHGEDFIEKAENDFVQKFQKKEIPEEIKEFKFDTDLTILDLLKEAKLVSSGGEARRLITQKAVKLDGDIVVDPFFKIEKGSDKILQVGKRHFLKLV